MERQRVLRLRAGHRENNGNKKRKKKKKKQKKKKKNGREVFRKCAVRFTQAAWTLGGFQTLKVILREEKADYRGLLQPGENGKCGGKGRSTTSCKQLALQELWPVGKDATKG